MKSTFVVDQKPLMAVLSSMQPICTKRTTLDATSSIMFQVGYKELILKSTDLEISLQSSYALRDSDVQEPHSFLVSGRRIFELVKELDGEISCTITDQQLLLKAGSVNLSLHIKNAEEFPLFPERIENLMQLDAAQLLDMINKVAFVIPQNNANPALNGLYLEIDGNGMTMTSTDGHCLAQAKSTKYVLEEAKKWLLPRRAIFEIKKLLESMIGGSTIPYSYRSTPSHSAQGPYNKLQNYVKKNFPQISFDFEYCWPGMIGVSKDLQPIVGKTDDIFFVSAPTGLAWAAAAAHYVTQTITESRSDFDYLLSPSRDFILPNGIEKILGKPATFAVANLLTLHE